MNLSKSRERLNNNIQKLTLIRFLRIPWNFSTKMSLERWLMRNYKHDDNGGVWLINAYQMTLSGSFQARNGDLP